MKRETWMQGVPEVCFVEAQDSGLTDEERDIFLQSRAQVAQKCTGRLKKPVFLFPRKVAKGPWFLPQESKRLNRELGRAAICRHWALPENPCPVLEPALLAVSENQSVYMIVDALYPPPSEEAPWVIETVSNNVSMFGPRTLEVVQRASTGVVRVSDRVAKDPEYLLAHGEVWEHLLHRAILQCGDSGLHNMLVRPSDDLAVGLDLDDMRDTDKEERGNWMSYLFKAPPARKIHPILQRSLEQHQAQLARSFARIQECINDPTTAQIVEDYQLDMNAWSTRLEWIQEACL